MSEVFLSLVIATYKRPVLLTRHLESLFCLTVPSSLNWEILIINNDAESDITPIVEPYYQKLPVRYFCENKLGKSNALNKGIQEAKGQWIAFSDDDVLFDKNWLIAAVEGIKRYPEATFFGGPIVAEFPGGILKWLEPGHIPKWLKGFLIHYDYGPHDKKFDFESMDAFYGAHIVIRKRWLDEHKVFDPQMGPIGYQKKTGGDVEAVLRLVGSGAEGYYLSQAIVRHIMTPDRLTVGKIYEYFEKNGRTSAYLTQDEIRQMTDKEFLDRVIINSLHNIAQYRHNYCPRKHSDQERAFQNKAFIIKKKAYLLESIALRSSSNLWGKIYWYFEIILQYGREWIKIFRRELYEK